MLGMHAIEAIFYTGAKLYIHVRIVYISHQARVVQGSLFQGAEDIHTRFSHLFLLLFFFWKTSLQRICCCFVCVGCDKCRSVSVSIRSVIGRRLCHQVERVVP